MVKQTDAWSLAAPGWEEPFWISKRAGCSETHRDASLLTSQKSHAGIYCKEQNRKYEDIHPAVKNWDHPTYPPTGTDFSAQEYQGVLLSS